MLILKSSAQHIFWLGRYLARIEYLCEHFPFYSNEMARRYAQVFVLDAKDADSLNELLIDQQHYGAFRQLYNLAKKNVHELSGVLTSHGFFQLNQLLDRAIHVPMPCIKLSRFSMLILENEPLHGLHVFYQLGMTLEQLDADIRLQQTYYDIAQQMQSYLQNISDLGHPQIEQSLIEIRNHLHRQDLSKITEQINSIFSYEQNNHD